MHTLILKINARKGTKGNTFTIEAVGSGPVKDAMREAIRGLEHHPAKTPRRALIDTLALIESHNFQIRHTEHTTDENDLEEWLFLLQG